MVDGGLKKSNLVIIDLYNVILKTIIKCLCNFREITLKHIGGGDEPVVWSEIESETANNALSLTPDGLVTVRGEGEIGVRVQLKKYPHVKAIGR